MIETEDQEVLVIYLTTMKMMTCLAHPKANVAPPVSTLEHLRTSSKTLSRRTLTTKMDSDKKTMTSMFYENLAETS